jgi:hypothetical protein
LHTYVALINPGNSVQAREIWSGSELSDVTADNTTTEEFVKGFVQDHGMALQSSVTTTTSGALIHLYDLTDSDSDGVPDSSDDYPNDAAKGTPESATGTGKILIDASSNAGASCGHIRTIADSDSAVNQTGKPSDYQFPDGLVEFKIKVQNPGDTVNVALTFPTPIPAGAKYYKVDANGFHVFSGAVITGSTITLTLRDGYSGDMDGMVDGIITDPGGVAVPTNTTTTAGGGGGGGGCFIASAAYGSPLAEDVRTLREFRDRYLMTNPPGRMFVRFYYQYSPSIAQYITRHEYLRACVRGSLKPVILSIRYPAFTLILAGFCVGGVLLYQRKRRAG